MFSLLSNSITPNFSGSGTGSPKTLLPIFFILLRACSAYEKYFFPKNILSLNAKTEEDPFR